MHRLNLLFQSPLSNRIFSDHEQIIFMFISFSIAKTARRHEEVLQRQCSELD